MAAQLTPYVNTSTDNEYLIELSAKQDVEAGIATSIASVVALIAEKGNSLTQTEIQSVANQLSALTTQYDELIAIEHRMIGIADEALANGASLLGYSPDQIIARETQRIAAYQSLRNGFANSINLTASTQDLLKSASNLANVAKVFGELFGPLWNVQNVLVDFSNGDDYAGLSGTVAGITELLIGAAIFTALEGASLAIAIPAALILGVGSSLLQDAVEGQLVKYDLLDIDELSPDPTNTAKVANLAGALELLSALDPNVSLEDALQLLDASSGTHGEHISSFFNLVRDYFEGGQQFESISDLAIAIREFRFQNQLSAPLVDLTAISDAEIAEIALQDTDQGQAVRYALVNLVPFAAGALEGTSAESTEYDLSNFTETYIRDRSAMLQGYLEGFISDEVSMLDVNGGWRVRSFLNAGQPSDYWDLGRSILVTNTDFSPDATVHLFGSNQDDEIVGYSEDRIYGLGGHDTLLGGSGNDHIEGGFDNDSLFGEEGNDFLYGDEGNDVLVGGIGDDLLDGAAGSDTYVFSFGDGNDIIRDGEGDNELIVNGRNLIGITLTAVAPGSNNYRELDQNGNPVNDDIYITSPGELLIAVGGLDSGDRIRIITFNDVTNNFGLTFDDSGGLQQPPLSGTTHEVGDGYYTDGASTAFLSRTSDDRVAGTSYIYDAALYAGNDPSTEENYPYIDSNDPSQGVHPFRFDGGDSNDVLTGTEHTPAVPQLNGVGGDWLNSGDGNDIIRGDQEASLTGDDDHLIGGRGGDQLYGGGGNDYLVGWNDQLVPFTALSYLPGPNSDTDYENAGDQDYLDGGEGNDVLVAGRGEDTLVGGAGADVIMANAGNDVITGGGGEDYIAADAYAITFTDGDNFYIAPDYHIDYTLSNNYSDVIDAGADDDIVHAGAGDDIVYGGAGGDSLYGDQVNNSIAHLLTIDGLPESSANLALRYADLAIEYHGNDYLDGGAGADYMFGNGGSDTVLGGEGDDIVFGDDYILTSDLHGNDYLHGGTGSDFLVGGGGSDTLYGGDDSDELYGDDGPRSITGYVNGTPIYGPPAYTVNGEEFIYQVAGEHQLSDSLFGGAGSDTLYGHGGDDYLDGGADDDFLYGGAGVDTIIGGTGNDTIESSNDVLIFSAGDGSDTVLGSGNEIHINGHIQSLEQASDSSIIHYGNGDQINFAEGSFSAIDKIMENGQVIDPFDYWVDAGEGFLQGTAGDDILYTSSVDATSMELGGGDDTVYVTSPDDISIAGDAGDDRFHIDPVGQTVTLKYDGNDGYDQIILDALSSDSLFPSREGDSLRVLVRPDGDDVSSVAPMTWIIFEDYFANDGISGSVVLSGGESIEFSALSDTLYKIGTDGNDNLVGDDDDNVFMGLEGDDVLNGRAGSDTFVYNLGDGSDVIRVNASDYESTDVIEFGLGINPEDLILRKAVNEYGGEFLSIQLEDGSHIRVDNHFSENHSDLIDELRFATGEIITSDQIRDLALIPTDNDDIIVGFGSDDEISGGLGNDTLNGIGGSDTYIYQLGDGEDTIVDAQGEANKLIIKGVSSVDELTWGNDRYDLVVGLPDGGSIRVANYVDYYIGRSNATAIAEFRVEDAGVTLSYSDVFDQAFDRDLIGTTGDDTLVGDDQDNFFVSGGGNDTIDPGAGDDFIDLTDSDPVDDHVTILRRRNDGDDIVSADYYYSNSTSNLSIYFDDPTIQPEDVETFIRFEEEQAGSSNLKPIIHIQIEGESTTLSIPSPATDYYGASQHIQLEFLDGSQFVVQRKGSLYEKYFYGPLEGGVNHSSITETVRIVQYMSDGDDSLSSGYGFPLYLKAGDGDDHVYRNDYSGDDVVWGEGGDDTLYGGDGSNTLYGGEGNDTISGSYDENQITGGPGDDLLLGGRRGTGLYFFSAGDGQDTVDVAHTISPWSSGNIIDSNGGTETLVFRDMLETDVEQIQVGDDLVINYGDGDSVTVLNHFQGGINEIEDVVFQFSPEANDDLYTVASNSSTHIDVEDLLTNDVDLGGGQLFVENVYDALNGSVSFTDTYNFLTGEYEIDEITFIADLDYVGTASFKYSISDGFDTAVATVYIDVEQQSVFTPPVATDDAFTIHEDFSTRIYFGDLLENDTDADGNILYVESVSNVLNGTADINENGYVLFTPNPDYHGTASFDYVISDRVDPVSPTDTATATITVESVNDYPVARDDVFRSNSGQSITIPFSALLANDMDVEGDSLTISSVYDINSGTVTVDSLNENVVVNPSSSGIQQVYFSYSAFDGYGYGSARVVVNFSDIDTPPVVNTLSIVSNEDSVVYISSGEIWSQVDDTEGNSVVVTAINNATNGTAEIWDVSGVDGIKFTPDDNFNGTASIEYEVSDGDYSAIGTIDITLNPVNDLPDAVDDVFAAAANTPLVLSFADLLANDTDVDGDTLSVTGVDNGLNGTVVFDDQTDTIIFTPDANFNGSASFDYSVSDGEDTATATVNVDVAAINDVPLASDDSAMGTEDNSIVLNIAELLANDTDADGDALTLSSVGNSTNGTVSVDAQAGTVTFVPDADYHGPASFEYTVSDGTDTASAQVALTVEAVNDNPVAGDDSGDTDVDSPVVFTLASLLGNDSDVDGDTLAIISVNNAVNGSAVLNSQTGTITFTPTNGYTGAASFDYTLSDGKGGTDSATVELSVAAGSEASTVLGTSGNDTLYGSSDSDVIDGGAGNDTLYDGSGGSDIYLFGAGDGQDSIQNHNNHNQDASDHDQLQFKAGISPADVVVSNNGNGLLLTLAGTDDAIEVNGYFGGDGDNLWRIDTVRFEDGTEWGYNTVKAMVHVPTAGDDTFYGFYGVDNTLDGGAGNDYLDGQSGNNTYLFGLGDGQDIVYNHSDENLDPTDHDAIQFKAGVSPVDVVVSPENGDLILTISGTDDQVRMRNYFDDGGNNIHRVDAIQFADGTSWDYASVFAMADSYIIQGTDGDDTLEGSNEDNTLHGGAGNDTLKGGWYGSDTYLFGPGDGEDTVHNYNNHNQEADDQDVLQFNAGIAPDDIVVDHDYNTLILDIVGSDDQVRVANYFRDDGVNDWLVDAIRFADGTEWDYNAVKDRVHAPTDGDDTFYGFDSIDDTLAGGAGNDYLEGNGGSNTYLFGLGDGQDYIRNNDGDNLDPADHDVLEFVVGIAPGDIQVSHNGFDLFLTVVSTGDQVQLSGYFHGGVNSTAQVDSINFADGTQWDYAMVESMVNVPTDGDDTLQGFWGVDNTLDGGAGNDYLNGSSGSNTYRFGLGDGEDYIRNINEGNLDPADHDVLEFKPGVTPDDILLSHSGGTLTLTLASTGENVRIRDYFLGGVDSKGRVDSIDFADGTQWDYAAVESMVSIPTDGDDTLFGFYGVDNTLDGGVGNDYLNGRSGSNTYRFGLGGGQDIIDNQNNANLEPNDQDRLVLDGIEHDQLWFSRNGNDLQIDYVGSNDQVTVDDWYSDDYHPLDTIDTTAGGYSLAYDQVDQLVNAMAQFDIPVGVGAMISQDQQEQLAPTIAAVWG